MRHKVKPVPDLEAPKRILVVDDEQDIQTFVSIILGHTGFHVECAGDGYQALEKIDALRPDLVVLDLMMPGLDGWAVLEELRRRPQRPRVVVLSACADPDRAAREGAVGCLAKPFHPRDLIRVCSEALAA